MIFDIITAAIMSMIEQEKRRVLRVLLSVSEWEGSRRGGRVVYPIETEINLRRIAARLLDAAEAWQAIYLQVDNLHFERKK